MTAASWYKHDVDMSADEKVIYLESQFGHLGYALFNKLLETLTRAENHTVAWNPISIAVYARKFFVAVEELERFIAEAIRPEVAAFVLQDGNLYSPGLLKRMEPMYTRKTLDDQMSASQTPTEKKRRKKQYDQKRYNKRQTQHETPPTTFNDDPKKSELMNEKSEITNEKSEITSEKSEITNEKSEISPVHPYKNRIEEKREEQKREDEKKREPHPQEEEWRNENFCEKYGEDDFPLPKTEIGWGVECDEQKSEVESEWISEQKSEVESEQKSELEVEEVTSNDDDLFRPYVFDEQAQNDLPEILRRLENFSEIWNHWVRYRRPSIFAARDSIELLTGHARNGFDPRKIISFTIQADFRVLARPGDAHRFDPAPQAQNERQGTNTARARQNPASTSRYVSVETPHGIFPYVPITSLNFSKAEHLRGKSLLTAQEYALVKNHSP